MNNIIFVPKDIESSTEKKTLSGKLEYELEY